MPGPVITLACAMVERLRVAYLVGNNALVIEVLAQASDDLYLFLGGQTPYGTLNDATGRLLVDCNEALVVHVGQHGHNELAVHAVNHAAVARDAVAKVFNVEGPLEPRSEESTKRRNE